MYYLNTECIAYLQMPLVNAATASASTSSAGAPLRVINHDSDDDFEDATDLMDDDDSIFIPERSNNRRIQPLIPDDFGTDDAMAAITFAEQFSNRYGNPHPAFFPGSLDDAIRESCEQPAKNVRHGNYISDLMIKKDE